MKESNNVYAMFFLSLALGMCPNLPNLFLLDVILQLNNDDGILYKNPVKLHDSEGGDDIKTH